MTHLDRLRAVGLFDARVPRYTSYPTANVFSPVVGPETQAEWLASLDPRRPVSVYLHIPFCERLCWFCACRTQGTKTLSPVGAYLDQVEAELRQLRQLLPAGVRMGRLHWGGGTPTILPPALIARLAAAVFAALPPAEGFEFSVETDPTMIDAPKVAALASAGMTRASIGVQDFDPRVQKAIGRLQPRGVTRNCVAALREAGVTSLNLDLVYGLPHQDAETLEATLDAALRLQPDRIALFGYAHVPHMAKRQRLIDETALPGDETRFALAERAAKRLTAAGFERIGIDHFARPGDSLAQAARDGTLRRNFQGYTEDTCDTLIGVGASAISRFAQGYVQNAAATADYTRRIGQFGLAGARGHAFGGDDRLRARAIEQLLCRFRTDDAALAAEFGVSREVVGRLHVTALGRFANWVALEPSGLVLRAEARPLARLIAQTYDAWGQSDAVFSKAS